VARSDLDPDKSAQLVATTPVVWHVTTASGAELRSSGDPNEILVSLKSKSQYAALDQQHGRHGPVARSLPVGAERRREYHDSRDHVPNENMMPFTLKEAGIDRKQSAIPKRRFRFRAAVWDQDVPRYALLDVSRTAVSRDPKDRWNKSNLDTMTKSTSWIVVAISGCQSWDPWNLGIAGVDCQR